MLHLPAEVNMEAPGNRAKGSVTGTHVTGEIFQNVNI